MAVARALIVVICGAGALLAAGVPGTASAQTLRAVCSVLSPHPCHPSFCSVFSRRPCVPYFEPPIGQDLRLTIVAADTSGAERPSAAGSGGADGDAKANVEAHTIDSIQAMFAALSACWIPPPKNEAHSGMQYTVRFAFKRDGSLLAPPRMTFASHDVPAEVRTIYRESIDAALGRCTPLHFSAGMAGAVAGRPINIRFIDDRMVDSAPGQP
jgi:hypothetical protein